MYMPKDEARDLLPNINVNSKCIRLKYKTLNYETSKKNMGNASGH